MKKIAVSTAMIALMIGTSSYAVTKTFVATNTGRTTVYLYCGSSLIGEIPVKEDTHGNAVEQRVTVTIPANCNEVKYYAGTSRMAKKFGVSQADIKEVAITPNDITVELTTRGKYNKMSTR